MLVAEIQRWSQHRRTVYSNSRAVKC